MTPNEALELCNYNDWANARLLKACGSLSQSRWSQGLDGSYPTLLSVVAHVVGAEWIWLRRWQGTSPTSAPGWFRDPTPSDLNDALEQVEEERRQFLGTLTAEDLEREVQYTLFDGSKGALALSTLLRHAMNHSTYHRGQIATMLRKLDVVPPSTDFLVYAQEQRATAARVPQPVE